MLKKHPLSALLISVLALAGGANAYADGDNHTETGDSISEHGANGSDVDHVAVMVGGTTTQVHSERDGHYEITLSNGTVVAVKPQGNTRIHQQTTGTTTTSVDADGHLHLQTADGYEMTVEPAAHSETETHTILAQNGLSNVTTSGARLTATRSDGSLLSLEADYQVSAQGASAGAPYVESRTGVDIDYADGTRQHFHGAPSDTNALRTSAQSLGYSVTFNSDGSVTATSQGVTWLVKLSPTLTQGAVTQPGLRLENNKVVMQYPNGLEQEVIVVQ